MELDGLMWERRERKREMRSGETNTNIETSWCRLSSGVDRGRGWIQQSKKSCHLWIDVVCRLVAENIQINQIRAHSQYTFLNRRQRRRLVYRSNIWRRCRELNEDHLYVATTRSAAAFNGIILIRWETIHFLISSIWSTSTLFTVHCSQDQIVSINSRGEISSLFFIVHVVHFSSMDRSLPKVNWGSNHLPSNHPLRSALPRSSMRHVCQ